MKFNSQICTTREQSERLLALGLKKETADMYHFQVSENDCRLRVDVDNNPLKYNVDDTFTPAWSFHRLIEMMPTYIEVVDDEYTLNIIQGKLIAYISAEKNNFLFAQGAVSLYDSVVAAIEWLVQAGYFNKEYLIEL